MDNNPVVCNERSRIRNVGLGATVRPSVQIDKAGLRDLWFLLRRSGRSQRLWCMAPRFSIVVPMKNEAENVTALVEEIVEACSEVGEYDIWLVDDGSTDETRSVIVELQDRYSMINLAVHESSAGQSAAIHTGILSSSASLICTLDGDGQNPPDQIPKLLQPMLAADRDPSLALVAGQRVGRKDTWSKRFASRFANGLRSWFLKDGTRDTGCGLKAFRRDAFLALPYFNQCDGPTVTFEQRRQEAMHMVEKWQSQKGVAAECLEAASRIACPVLQEPGAKTVGKTRRKAF